MKLVLAMIVTLAATSASAIDFSGYYDTDRAGIHAESPAFETAFHHHRRHGGGCASGHCGGGYGGGYGGYGYDAGYASFGGDYAYGGGYGYEGGCCGGGCSSCCSSGGYGWGGGYGLGGYGHHHGGHFRHGHGHGGCCGQDYIGYGWRGTRNCCRPSCCKPVCCPAPCGGCGCGGYGDGGWGGYAGGYSNYDAGMSYDAQTYHQFGPRTDGYRTPNDRPLPRGRMISRPQANDRPEDPSPSDAKGIGTPRDLPASEEIEPTRTR